VSSQLTSFCVARSGLHTTYLKYVNLLNIGLHATNMMLYIEEFAQYVEIYADIIYCPQVQQHEASNRNALALFMKRVLIMGFFNLGEIQVWSGRRVACGGSI
jgi:hypothetical protein